MQSAAFGGDPNLAPTDLNATARMANVGILLTAVNASTTAISVELAPSAISLAGEMQVMLKTPCIVCVSLVLGGTGGGGGALYIVLSGYNPVLNPKLALVLTAATVVSPDQRGSAVRCDHHAQQFCGILRWQRRDRRCPTHAAVDAADDQRVTAAVAVQHPVTVDDADDVTVTRHAGNYLIVRSVSYAGFQRRCWRQ